MNGQWPYTQKEMREKFGCRVIAQPSSKDVVNAFVSCLSASTPGEREMMITYLRSKACIECGAPDPNCPCWERDEAIPS